MWLRQCDTNASRFNVRSIEAAMSLRCACEWAERGVDKGGICMSREEGLHAVLYDLRCCVHSNTNA